jgi:hypothetical protein
MLGINCWFSTIVPDEFVTPVEGRHINAYGVLDEGHMEAGDRAPDAPDMLHLVALGESDLHLKMLFCLYRPWYHTACIRSKSSKC